MFVPLADEIPADANLHYSQKKNLELADVQQLKTRWLAQTLRI